MKKSIALFSVACVALTSCTTQTPQNQEAPTQQPNAKASGPVITLDNTKWSSEEFNANLDFQNGNYGANTGCNTLGGTYKILDNIVINFEDPISTMMYCGEDVMKDENNLKEFLTKVNTFEYTDESLILKSEDKTVEFTPAKMASLTDTKWKLSSMLIEDAMVSDISFENAFVEFSEDGNIGGKAICNSFSGSYTKEDTELNIGTLASTLMLCSDENAAKYESQMLADLQNISKYEISRNTLELSNTDDSVRLQFMAQ